MDRAFEVAAFKMTKDRSSWITIALDALYEAQRRQAISDIRRHRHLFRCAQHIARRDQAAGDRRAMPARKQAAAPNGVSPPLVMMQGALIAVLALFFCLLLHVLA